MRHEAAQIKKSIREEVMLEVMTYEVDQVEDRLLEFAVVLSKYQGKWILCRHKKRQT